jgi:PGDYG protein
MIDKPLTEFRSSGRPGFSSTVSGDPRRVAARKREREVQVRFATEACMVQTPEGAVRARSGDALLTGDSGDQWRVTRARFPEKYRPVPPTTDGSPGTYATVPIEVLALQMQKPFAVVLTDGESRLTGRPGDWLVDYGDGSLGIVAAVLFPTIYDVRA